MAHSTDSVARVRHSTVVATLSAHARRGRTFRHEGHSADAKNRHDDRVLRLECDGHFQTESLQSLERSLHIYVARHGRGFSTVNTTRSVAAAAVAAATAPTRTCTPMNDGGTDALKPKLANWSVSVIHMIPVTTKSICHRDPVMRRMSRRHQGRFWRAAAAACLISKVCNEPIGRSGLRPPYMHHAHLASNSMQSCQWRGRVCDSRRRASGLIHAPGSNAARDQARESRCGQICQGGIAPRARARR